MRLDDMAYKFNRKESAEESVRRIAREQLRKAIEEMGDEERDQHDTVHQVRKRFKKIRGLLRLVRPGLGERYGELNRRYRDAGRQLSRVRDAESMLEALRRLRKQYDKPLDDATFADAEQHLKKRREKIADEWLDLDEELIELREDLQAARNEVKELALSKEDRGVVLDGFTKSYGRGCRARLDCVKNRIDESLHEWRKRMKYHWYHLRLLRNVWKPVVKARIDELDWLSDLLGDDHDLAVFSRSIKDDPESFGSEQSIELLMGAIARRRRQLQKSAFQLGNRVCAEKPKAIRNRFKHYWIAWKGYCLTH